MPGRGVRTSSNCTRRRRRRRGGLLPAVGRPPDGIHGALWLRSRGREPLPRASRDGVQRRRSLRHLGRSRRARRAALRRHRGGRAVRAPEHAGSPVRQRALPQPAAGQPGSLFTRRRLQRHSGLGRAVPLTRELQRRNQRLQRGRVCLGRRGRRRLHCARGRGPAVRRERRRKPTGQLRAAVPRHAALRLGWRIRAVVRQCELRRGGVRPGAGGRPALPHE
jgi:hypothetical protein